MKKYLPSAVLLLVFLVLLAINVNTSLLISSKFVQLEKNIALMQYQLFQLEQTEANVRVSWAENVQPGINHVAVDTIAHFDYPHEWGSPIVREYRSRFWAGKKQIVTFNPQGMHYSPTITAYYADPDLNVQYPFDIEFSKPELARNVTLQKAFMGSAKSNSEEACKSYANLFALKNNCQKFTNDSFSITDDHLGTVWFVATPKREEGASQPFYSGFIIHDQNDTSREAVQQMITSLQPIGTWHLDARKLLHS